MKVIITGATGMIGKGVLLECLDHESIDEVLSLSRNSLGIDHPKLKQVLHSDFSNYDSIKSELTGYDACYLCMGVSSVGMNEEDYTKITYTYTLNLAKALLELNPNLVCTYVSGQSTDSSEKGKTMWARVKGKTENDLLALGFKDAYMFRPGGIIPLRGIKSRTKMYQFMLTYMGWLLRLIKLLSPNSIVNTTQIGLAMIHVTQRGYEKKIIDPVDIIRLAEPAS